MTPEQEFCQTWSLRWKVQNQKNFYSALILGRKKTNQKKAKYQRHIQAVWETSIPVWALKLKKHFSSFFLHCISTKNMFKKKSMISQCIQLFLNGFKDKNADRREKL